MQKIVLGVTISPAYYLPMGNDDDKSALANQIQGLMSTAQAQSIQVQEARSKFEELRERLLKVMSFADEQHREGMRVALENIFTFGHDAGSASENALAIREQMDLIVKMTAAQDKQREENIAREDARNKIRDELDERYARTQERQAEALETIARLLDGEGAIEVKRNVEGAIVVKSKE